MPYYEQRLLGVSFYTSIALHAANIFPKGFSSLARTCKMSDMEFSQILLKLMSSEYGVF